MEPGQESSSTEAFATFCAANGMQNRELCLAILPCVLAGKPKIPTSFVVQEFRLSRRQICQVSADLLMEGVHYAVDQSHPMFSPEGLQKLAEHQKRPDLSAAITRCLTLSSSWMATQLRERERAIIAEKRKTSSLLEKLSSKYASGQRIYVVQNPVYDSSPIYKIGRTKDLEKRLVTYNTGSPDDVTVVYEVRCSDSKLVEQMIAHILHHYRSESNREYYRLPLRQIKEVVDHCVDSCDGYRERMMGKLPRPLEVPTEHAETEAGRAEHGTASASSERTNRVTAPTAERTPPVTAHRVTAPARTRPVTAAEPSSSSDEDTTPRATRWACPPGETQAIPTPPELRARLRRLAPGAVATKSRYFQ